MKQNSKDLRDVNISEERRSKIEKIIEKKFSGFEENEKKEIFLGLLHELTLPQVALYANRNLNAQQMQEIRLCFEHGLTLKQIFVFFECYRHDGWGVEKFDAEQLHEVRLMHEKGMPFRLVSFLTTFNSEGEPIFDAKQMHEIYLMYEEGMSQEEISKYAQLDDDQTIYSAEQMREIRLMYKHGLTQEQISKYAKLYYDQTIYSAEQMHEIRLMLEDGMPSQLVSFVTDYSSKRKPIFDDKQMHEIRLMYKHGLTQEQISEYAQDWCDSRLMRLARLILEEENSKKRKL